MATSVIRPPIVSPMLDLLAMSGDGLEEGTES